MKTSFVVRDRFQITVPDAVRELLDVHIGDVLEAEITKPEKRIEDKKP